MTKCQRSRPWWSSEVVEPALLHRQADRARGGRGSASSRSSDSHRTNSRDVRPLGRSEVDEAVRGASGLVASPGSGGMSRSLSPASGRPAAVRVDAELVGTECLEQERRRARAGRRRASASVGRGSRRHRRGGAPPRARAPAPATPRRSGDSGSGRRPCRSPRRGRTRGPSSRGPSRRSAARRRGRARRERPGARQRRRGALRASGTRRTRRRAPAAMSTGTVASGSGRRRRSGVGLHARPGAISRWRAAHRARTASIRAGSGRPASVADSASSTPASTSGDVTSSSIGRRPERDRRSRQTAIAGSSSRLVRARIACVAVVVRPACRRTRPMRTVSSDESRARTMGRSPPAPPGSSSANRSGCARRGDGTLDDRRRAAVVHHEVDATQARAGRRRGEAPGGRRRAASRRSTDRRRRRRRSGSPARRAAARAGAALGRGPAPRRRGAGRSAARHRDRTAGDDSSSRSERATRSSKSRPPVVRDRLLVGDEGPCGRARARDRRHLVGRHAEVELQPRERRVERPPAGRSGVGRDPPQDRHPVDERLDGLAGVAQDLEPEGVERPDSGPHPVATPSGSSAAATRSRSSSAARVLNVIAAISSGRAAPDAISQATRATSVVVLPLPAGATQRSGPGGAVAAARWSGASRARRFSTDQWSSIS